MTQRDYVEQIPVLTRTQRRLERRQMWMMVILMAAVTVASFFLGVMVGERSAVNIAAEPNGPAVAQVAPPPPPPSAAVAPRKLTFYEDLPKGNAAPLGSGINLPKGGYVAPPPAAAPPAAAMSAPPAPAPSPQPAVAPPAPKAAPAKAGGDGDYVVQVLSTPDEGEARRVVKKLQGSGMAASYERADLGAKGVRYRVVAGPYDDQAAAEKAVARLKQQKFSVIMRKR